MEISVVLMSGRKAKGLKWTLLQHLGGRRCADTVPSWCRPRPLTSQKTTPITWIKISESIKSHTAVRGHTHTKQKDSTGFKGWLMKYTCVQLLLLFKNVILFLSQLKSSLNLRSHNHCFKFSSTISHCTILHFKAKLHTHPSFVRMCAFVRFHPSRTSFRHWQIYTNTIAFVSCKILFWKLNCFN